MRIAIIGAGLAGLTCGATLQAAGHTVTLFDKGRGPGGRMASRQIATPLGDAAFDHGAQYFTVRDERFRRHLDGWAAMGVVAPWPEAGSDAWVGVPMMSTPIKALAGDLDVRWGAIVTGLSRQGARWVLNGEGVGEAAVESAVIAVPAEQAAPLLAPWAPDFARRALAAISEPCWTVMAAFSERVLIAIDSIRGAGPIGWAARNSAKPGRTGPEAWVIQATPDWSRLNLEATPETIVPLLLEAFSIAIGQALPPHLIAVGHRWRYAKSGASGEGALWDPELRLGACGDWLIGPRVECAWLSGSHLGRLINQG